MSTPSNPDVLVSAIKLTIADDSAGTYTCKAVQYDDICNNEQEFPSADVILEVIAAVPITQPLSATVLEGTNHELTCVFPNPFDDTTYEIVWSFERKVSNLIVISPYVNLILIYVCINYMSIVRCNFSQAFYKILYIGSSVGRAMFMKNICQGFKPLPIPFR